MTTGPAGSPYPLAAGDLEIRANAAEAAMMARAAQFRPIRGEKLDPDNDYRVTMLRSKASREGWKVEDLAWYSLDAVKALTEAVLGGFVPQSPKGTRGGSGGDPAEGGNLQASLADVGRALYRLMTPEHRATLVLAHAGYIEPDAEALDAAYTDLQRCLGGPRPRGL